MKTADPELMRAINRYHIMDAIRRWGPICRTDICARTDLSSTTISAITAALIEDRLIVPHPTGGIRSSARGRPRVMLDINPDAARVIGVKIAPQGIVLAATNFKGDVLAAVSIPVRVDRQPVMVVTDLIEDGVRRCVADANLWLKDINSLCVALPGLIEHASGFVHSSPVLNDSNVPLGESLAQRFDMPITIESDANAAAVAEHWFRKFGDLEDFIVVSIERSVDLAVMHEGQLFRGARGMSFDVGSLVAVAPEGDPQAPGRVQMYTPNTLIREALRDDHDYAGVVGRGRGMEYVLSRLERGHGELEAAIARSGEVLGRVIANIVTLFVPSRVVLVGRALILGDYLLAPLRRAFTDTIPRTLATISQIVVDDIDTAEWARGAAGVALRDLYGSPWGTTGPVPIRTEREQAIRERR